jgi:hypothetical protein
LVSTDRGAAIQQFNVKYSFQWKIFLANLSITVLPLYNGQ